MKLKIYLTICLAIALNIANTNAQCNANGIFTRPDSAVNTLYPPKKNNFDWMKQKYITNTTYSTAGNDSIWSPIYQPDNFIIDHLRLATDMKPSDGWEILKKDFGFDDNAIANNPKADFCYLFMYNKYTATLRAFIARKTPGVAFTNALIKIEQIESTQANGISQSSLLDLSEGLIPLDVAFVKNKHFSSPSSFDNNENKWFFADFPMQYDPCTCFYTSRLKFDIQLITNSTINLEGSSTGTIAAINNTQNILNQGAKTYSFADLIAGGKKALETYKSITSFKDAQLSGLTAAHSTTPTANTANTAKTNLNLLQQILKKSNFLKGGLQAAPYIGAAASLLDFFTAGGKKETGPQEVQLTPMSINFTTKLSGNITTSFPYGFPIFWNPGSKILTQFNDYPYYNEIMGVFNMFETPEIKYWRGTRQKLSSALGDWEQVYEFRLTKPLKYVLNPAARLAIQDVQVAIVVETGASEPNDNNPYKGDWVYEGLDVNTNSYHYRTPYTDVTALNSTFNSLTVGGTPAPGDYFQFPEGKVFIKFLVNLRRTMDTAGAQNVLMVLKYPAKFLQTTIKLSTQPQPSGSLFVPATGAEINTYCNSGTYKTNRVSSRINPRVPDVEATIDIKNYVDNVSLMPNPANKKTILALELSKPVVLNIYLTDISGRKVLTQATGKQFFGGIINEEISLDNLSKGVYFVVIEKNKTRIVKKLIIQ